MHVTETNPSCTSVTQYSLESQSLTSACYRCDKTAFFEVLVTVGTILFAQVVLTLRSVVFGRDGFMLITAE